MRRWLLLMLSPTLACQADQLACHCQCLPGAEEEAPADTGPAGDTDDTDDTEVPDDTDDTEVPDDTDDTEVPDDTDDTDDTELPDDSGLQDTGPALGFLEGTIYEEDHIHIKSEPPWLICVELYEDKNFALKGGPQGPWAAQAKLSAKAIPVDYRVEYVEGTQGWIWLYLDDNGNGCSNGPDDGDPVGLTDKHHTLSASGVDVWLSFHHDH